MSGCQYSSGSISSSHSFGGGKMSNKSLGKFTNCDASHELYQLRARLYLFQVSDALSCAVCIFDLLPKGCCFLSGLLLVRNY